MDLFIKIIQGGVYMSFINPFQLCSEKENTTTNNILLFLSNLYRIDSKIYELFINSILPDNVNYNAILVFEQQKTQKEGGIIDGYVEIKSSKIIIKTELDGTDRKNKLINYCKNIYKKSEQCPETNILIHLSTSAFNEEDMKSINKEVERDNFCFVSTTYAEFVSLIQNITDEYYFKPELHLLNEYFYDYCSSSNLIKDLFRIVPCGKSFDLNKKYHLYFQPVDRGYSNHKFIGIYQNKEVKYIGKISKIVYAELLENKDLTTKNISGKEEISKEEKERIINTMKEFPKVYGFGDISKGHVFFLFDKENFCATKFKKTSKYGLLGSKFFELKTLLNIKSVNKLTTDEIAERLKKKTW